MWRGGTTGQIPAYRAYEAKVSKRDRDVKKYANVPLNTRLELVTRFGTTASVAGIKLDVGFSGITPAAGAAAKGLLRDSVKPKATIADFGRCKYQLSNEGNDVATGLKWQLYTDSVVLIPRRRRASPRRSCARSSSAASRASTSCAGRRAR